MAGQINNRCVKMKIGVTLTIFGKNFEPLITNISSRQCDMREEMRRPVVHLCVVPSVIWRSQIEECCLMMPQSLMLSFPVCNLSDFDDEHMMCLVLHNCF